MFKNVLVGVNGTETGRDAIALAAQLTDPDGKLTLAHVHEGQLHPNHAIVPGILDEERQASADLLTAERAAADVKADLVSIAAYTPGRGLHEEAEVQGADLLVVGSCAHSLLGRAMLGDDTRAALNGAPCAVAIAPVGYAEHPVALSRIGVAYNESPESEAAFALAKALAATKHATVHAMEVVAVPSAAYTGVLPPLFDDSLEAILEEATARINALPNTEGRATYGLTGEELAQFGDELDILVLGSRGYGPFKRLVLGSTSDYLQRHARCALLVLPRGVTLPTAIADGAKAQVAEPVGASV